MSPRGRVDAHVHVWDLAQRPQPWTRGQPVLQRSFTPDELAATLQEAGVARCVVVQTVPDPDETTELLAQAQAATVIAGVVGWVDPYAHDIAAQVLAHRERAGDALVGIRLQLRGDPAADRLADPRLRRGLRALAAIDVPIDLLVRSDQLPSVLEAASAHPHARFVLDHVGRLLPPVGSDTSKLRHDQLTRIEAQPNITVKLSWLLTAPTEPTSMARARAGGAEVLDRLGAGRCMFASDWPASVAVATYRRVTALTASLLIGASADEQDQVWRGTACAVYGLDTRTPTPPAAK